jgi:UDP-glucose 4-epimerase
MMILVTGGAGYIGSHTCKCIAAAGYRPVVLDNLVQGHRWAAKWGPLIVGDISDSELVRLMDLAEAHLRAVSRLWQGEPGDRVNLGTGRGHTIREVISAVEAVSGRSVPYREEPRRAGDPAALVADPTRAEAVLGWRPRLSELRSIVETAWRWHENHG